MISGVMPSAKWKERGYPYYEALRSWCRVCDEIVIITHGKDDLDLLFDLITKEMPETDHKMRFEIRSVTEPPLDGFASYGSYLMFGMMQCTSPDWVLSIEADFLISPKEAKLLRDMLNQPSNMEVLMADVVTLNYDAKRLIERDEFREWFPPNDGATWYRPIGYRPKLGVFPVPFSGVNTRNVRMCCEDVMFLQEGRWGASFNSKFMSDNPDKFKLMNSGVVIEHLTFSRSPEFLKKKMSNDVWSIRGVDIDIVLEGTSPYMVSYQELDMARRRYEAFAKQLRVKDE